MKKTLLLQTALVAAAGMMLADASFAQVKASPPAVTVGGYFTQFFKAQDRDNTAQVDQAAVAFSSDAEVWFNLRSVLDNGMVITGRIELEASTYTDQIDERYVILSRSDIGTAEIGSTDRISGKMLYFAPNVLPGHSSTVHSEYSAAPAGLGPLMWFVNSNHDAEGINLYTANDRYFGSKAGKGLQLGLSYVPDGCEDFTQATGAAAASVAAGSGRSCGGNYGATTGGLGSNVGNTSANQISQQWQVGANFVETIEGHTVALYGSYITGHQEGTIGAGRKAEADGWQLGAQVSFDMGQGAAVIVGGGYTREDVESATTKDRKGWSAGIRYLTNGANTGSIGVGVEYYARKDRAPVTLLKTDYDIMTAGLTYQLGPGVLTFAGLGRVENDVPGAGIDTKQTFGVVGFGVTF